MTIELDIKQLETTIIQALQSIYDPEIPVNIYDLGLIYKLDIDPSGFVRIQMTLTTPHCPVAATFPGTVEATIRAVENVTNVNIELVWEPPWSKENMSEAAKLQLGLL